MRVGIIIGRFGDIDGVSLETQKWIEVLGRMGHDVFVLTGRLVPNDRNPKLDYTILPPLSFFSPECEWEQKRAFFYPDDDPDMLLAHLDTTSNYLAMKIFEWKLTKNIQVLISENASALPSHLSMGMAIEKVVQNSKVPIITHDHDFFWERGDRYGTPFPEIEKIMDECFPLKQSYVKHAVINTDAQTTLRDRFGINSTMVPNVMDFDRTYGRADDYNRTLKQDFGFAQDDILLFQITRIVRRKGIETAVELVHKLDDDRVKLVVTGSKADDERFGYYKELTEGIKEHNLDKHVFFGAGRIRHYRSRGKHGDKIYSLSDSYANATACTYFSTYEGFGNAFVECVLAGKPIFVNNYKPVFWPDIGSKGFEVVMTEDNVLTDKHIEEVRNVIYNPERRREIAGHNYELAKDLFSYDILEQKLEQLLGTR